MECRKKEIVVEIPIPSYKLTYKQRGWLVTRGGREEKDVFYVQDKPYIWMTGEERADIKVRVPDDSDINIWRDGSTGRIRTIGRKY